MATTTLRTSEGDILDTLCIRHYGHLNGTVEAVLAANPGLARVPQPMQSGIFIQMPEVSGKQNEVINLWS